MGRRNDMTPSMMEHTSYRTILHRMCFDAVVGKARDTFPSRVSDRCVLARRSLKSASNVPPHVLQVNALVLHVPPCLHPLTLPELCIDEAINLLFYRTARSGS